ncbi:EthD family reductase [Marinobacter caseinilyticus]|uniref:EthD family reductase n=1 Tax=Marinobacter caseinilyticus TaxID=2692195 RepID=UPI0014072661|nr:EthD family reductase [Marinobacter caseinilyticus]
MIKVSVLYPKTDFCSFNMDYYRDTHMPLVEQKLGAACTRVAIEQGLTGAAPDQSPAYAAMGHLYFDTVTAFQQAFAPHADAIMADLPNFTNIEPVIQISEVIR